jgi:transmembrane sensor
MITKLENIGKLIGKYLRQELTEEEQKQLNEWINESDDNKTLFEKWTDTQELMRNISDWERLEKGKQDIWQKMDVGADEKKPSSRLLNFQWWKYAAAAAIILFVSLGAYLWYKDNNRNEKVAKTDTPQVPVTNDVKPGQFKAKLTLADGTIIVLDSAKNGTLVQEGGTNIVNKDGKLVYEKGGQSNKVLYNILSTSKAQTYATVLSDGTKVWLNSESSIHYPVAFNGDVRKVEITGEAYFEVAASIGKNGKRPFIVSVNGMEIEVLGTHFNVNGYADEPAMKTTLLEGKVKVRSVTTNEQTILAPGEQAILPFVSAQDKLAQDGKAKLDKTKDVDVDAEVAWRFGYFNFNNTDMKTLMRQLERWYDVKVEYQGEVPDVQSFGEIPRELSLSQVLSVLQRKDVHFKMIGKKIIVTPK